MILATARIGRVDSMGREVMTNLGGGAREPIRCDNTAGVGETILGFFSWENADTTAIQPANSRGLVITWGSVQGPRSNRSQDTEG